jgi:hypothetical protein
MALEKESKKERRIMFGFAILFFTNGLLRIFYFFSDYMVIGGYTGHAFFGEYEIAYPIYELMLKLAYVSTIAGMALVFFEFEREMKRTKYSLTIVNIIFLIPTALLPINTARNLNFFFGTIDAAIFILLLIWFSKKSSQEFQAVSVIMLIGFLLYLAGSMLDSRIGKELGIIPAILPPFLIILGSVFAISPTFINPEYFSRSSLYWSILSIFNCILLFIFFYGILVLIIPEIYVIPMWIVISSVIITTIYSFSRIAKILKAQSRLERYSKTPKKQQDFLKIFTKPRRVTEEEVSISKEKKICLVCKNKVSRLNYICPDCNAIYCVKCSDVLSNEENMCWVCDTRFDESKPIQTPVEEEKLPDDEGKERKKKVETIPKLT